jgi:group II intron reverse transcriptase/maturase
MMNEYGKSDRSIVPKKSPNKAGQPEAEGMEGRDLAKGNLRQPNTFRTQSRGDVPSELERVREAAKKSKDTRFTTLFHYVYDLKMLEFAYFKLKREAAPGVDGETWRHYGEDLEMNLQDLSHRLRRGAYRAKPARRRLIPKSDGRRRPLGVTALEDKLVQRAAVEVMNAIYEQDFADFSYGFRPGRSQHQALDQLYLGIYEKKVNWVLDLDIQAFFDSLSQNWLVKFIEHRIGDRRVVRLIQKWLSAGVLEEGKLTISEEGTPQGGSASPLLANVYLHYVFDQWIQVWQRKIACGNMHVVRFADDIVIGFQEKAEAERFGGELKERMKKFNLGLHPEKTRLLEFGRFAAQNRKKRGEGKPETYNFLGFTHICGKTQKGWFAVIRQTIRKRMKAKLKTIKIELRKRINDPLEQVGQWLKAVVGGHIRYYGVPTNIPALQKFRHTVGQYWHRMMCRRSQLGHVKWKRMQCLIDRWLPPARICHPYPSNRRRVST